MPITPDRLALHRAHSLMWQAHGLLRAGRVAQAREHYAYACRVFADADEPKAEGEARLNLGAALLALGEQLAAIPQLERAARLGQLVADSRIEAGAAGALGAVLLDRGEPTVAEPLLLRAMELAEAIGERQRIGGALLGLATLHHDARRFDVAVALCERACVEARAALSDGLAVAALSRLASLRQESGDPMAARTLWHDALAAAQSSGAPDDLAITALGWGGWLLEAGHPEEALDPLRTARSTFAALKDPQSGSGAVARLAVARATLDDPDRAARLFAEAEALAGEQPTRGEALAVHRGHLLLAEGRQAGDPNKARAKTQALLDSVAPDAPARLRFAARLLGRALSNIGPPGSE